MTPILRVYVGAVIAGGTVALGANMPRVYDSPALAATFLAAMVVVSLFKLRIPLFRGEATMSMAYVIDFLVLVTSGADVAMVIATAGVLVQCLVNVRRRQHWYRTAFSVATVVLAVQAAGWVWSVGGGTVADPGVYTTLLPLAAAAVVYFAINSGLVAGAIALSAHSASLPGLAREFLRIGPAFLIAGASVALVQMVLTRDFVAVMPVLAIPVVACHLAYAAWFRRLAERRRPSPVSV